MSGPHRFHHVGITVSNLEASYAFYRDVLGMRFWDQEKALGTEPTEGRLDAKQSDADVTFHSLKSEAFDELTANPG